MGSPDRDPPFSPEQEIDVLEGRINSVQDRLMAAANGLERGDPRVDNNLKDLEKARRLLRHHMVPSITWVRGGIDHLLGQITRQIESLERETRPAD